MSTKVSTTGRKQIVPARKRGRDGDDKDVSASNTKKNTAMAVTRKQQKIPAPPSPLVVNNAAKVGGSTANDKATRKKVLSNGKSTRRILATTAAAPKKSSAGSKASVARTYADVSPGKHLSRSYSFDYENMDCLGGEAYSPSRADYDRGAEILAHDRSEGEVGDYYEYGGGYDCSSSRHQISYEDACHGHARSDDDYSAASSVDCFAFIDEEQEDLNRKFLEEEAAKVEQQQQQQQQQQQDEASTRSSPRSMLWSEYSSSSSFEPETDNEEESGRSGYGHGGVFRASETAQPSSLGAASDSNSGDLLHALAINDLIFSCTTTVAEIDWSDVILFVKDPEQHASLPRGFLHHAITKNAPLSVAEAIVKGKPYILFDETYYMYHKWLTPLGAACRSHASLDMIRFLIKEMVEVQSKSSAGRELVETSGGLFHTTGILESDMSLEMMKILLEEHPQGALALIKSNFIPQKHVRLGVEFAFSKQNDPQYLEKLKLLLMAGCRGKLEDTELNGFLLPHAFIEVLLIGEKELVSDPPEEYDMVRVTSGVEAGLEAELVSIDEDDAVLKDDCGRIKRVDLMDVTKLERPRDHFAEEENAIIDTLAHLMSLVPDQFQKRDGQGNLPLHIVLSNDAFRCRGERQYAAATIQYLLGTYPEATSIRAGNGRLPLHIAIDYGAPCYKLIVDSSPSWVLETKCPVTKLYPFQQQRKVRVVDEHLCTEMSYEILRKAPAMVAVGLSSRRESWFESDLFKKIQIEEMTREQKSAKMSSLKK